MPTPPANHLLAALPAEDFSAFGREIETVTLRAGEVVHRRHRSIRQVFFPQSTVISSVIMSDNKESEIATVGQEGMIGVSLLLGDDVSYVRSFAQIEGDAYRMNAEAFQELAARNPAWQSMLHRYTIALLNQTAQYSACNTLHPVEKRLSRWLLIFHDRVASDSFPLKQRFLADMLSVRRATVTEIAGKLQKAGLITYSRGKMTILKRSGLEARSCECYRLVRQEYQRLLHFD